MRMLTEQSRRLGASVAAAMLSLAVGVVPVGLKAQSASDDSNQSETEASESKETPSEVEKALSLAETAYHAGEWPDAKEAYRKAYNKASADNPFKVQAALGLSSIEWEQGEYQSARKHVEAALDYANALDLDEAIGRLLLTLGHIQASQGQLSEAEQTLSRCISLASAQNDAVFGPLCRLNHRMVRKLQGKDIGSERIYKQALEKLKSVDTPMTVGMSLTKTAQLYSKSGDYSRALSMIDEAERQYQKAASEPAQARIRLDRARLLQEVGKWNAARNQLAGLAETFRKMGSKPALVDTYGLLGDDARHRGNTSKAAKYYNQALSYAKAAGSPQLIAKVQVALCELSTESVDQCRSALSTFEGMNMPVLKARAKSALARKFQEKGQLEKARAVFIDVIDIIDTDIAAGVVPPSMKAANLSNLCQVEARAGVTGAFSRCREAVSVIESMDDKNLAMLAVTRYALGTAAIREGSPEEGVEQLIEAANGFDTLDGQKTRAANARLRAGEALKEANLFERAAKQLQKGLDGLDDGESHRTLRIQLRTQLAQVLSERQKYEKSAEVLQKLIEEARAAGDYGTAAWAYSALARTRVNRGDDAGAKKALEKGIGLAEKAGDKELKSSMQKDLEQWE